MDRPAPSSPLLLAGASAGVVGALWWHDARRRNRRSALLHRTMVELLLNTLCAGDPVTARHSRRVADLTGALARCFGLRGEARARLRVASLLHDLGKLDDRVFPIVHSNHRLSASERTQVNRHPHEGADILEPLEALHPGISFIVESHHERWDGKGYPRGLREDRIPLEARIISVSDFFDALTQWRSYKEPKSVEETLAEIRADSGSRFDPEVVRRLDGDVLAAWSRIARGGCAAERTASERRDAEESGAEETGRSAPADRSRALRHHWT